MIIMYIMLLESHVSVLDKNFVVYRSYLNSAYILLQMVQRLAAKMIWF